MTDKITSGGPAFPSENHALYYGMSLRDYFAAKAIPALIANFLNNDLDLVDPEGWMDGLAMDAYSMADAMLKAREQ